MALGGVNKKNGRGAQRFERLDQQHVSLAQSGPELDKMTVTGKIVLVTWIRVDVDDAGVDHFNPCYFRCSLLGVQSGSRRNPARCDSSPRSESHLEKA